MERRGAAGGLGRPRPRGRWAPMPTFIFLWARGTSSSSEPSWTTCLPARPILRFSRANRWTSGKDRMFRSVDNLMEWIDLGFHGWCWKFPQGFERGRERCGPTIEREQNPRDPGSGVYIPQRYLSVVPTQARCYRGLQEIERVSSYRKYWHGVSSTEGVRQYQHSIGKTLKFQNSNSQLISVLPTSCRLYRQTWGFWEKDWEPSWDRLERKRLWTCRAPIEFGD
jgi:hypothetical protein